ncbi:ATP-binding protein involved in chromosome partitioning [Arcanobacterium pluranimalium]|uniref:Mrp/NBP35 family ATP-binding protein n=1 Tax=Arcanobacterium pluranimalium TaxID=108028 RepID=UPI001958AA68|nr:P-loop NTPase [Arcanobacterium pluranimalium]MBM7825077.1 ATP-binding protein involved in chromosome partitioning [Arcanobacterium pluranimalium]
MTLPSVENITAELAKVIDPEIRRPITELGMVRSVEVHETGKVTVHIDLTTAGCPLRDTITADVKKVLGELDGVIGTNVVMGVMDEEQKAKLRETLRGGAPERVIPFAQPGNLTRVYAISSGKGGVGKSSMTVNLATAMAASGLKVGIVDADIYGFSIPQMMGVDTPPQVIDKMIIPPVAHGVKVISIGMFLQDNSPVVWRGPMLHRALEQFFGDVFWGDLDALLIDLPPGTGDIAISVAQLIPGAEIVVVTTPQSAAAEVAERAGVMASQTEQRVVGVIENMSYLAMPDGTRMEIFGAGGGDAVAQQLTNTLGYDVPVIATVPLEQPLREGGDAGVPLAIQEGESTAQTAIREAAASLAKRARGLSGRSLGVSPA